MNVLIIDDHEEIAEGVKTRVLNVFPEANCFFASKSRDAVFIVRSQSINLILCDLEFKNDPINDGWTILAKIHAINPKIKTIAYTSHSSYQVMKESIKFGFHSFLEKGCSLDDFATTLEGVMEFGDFESPTIARLKKKRYTIIDRKFHDSLESISELSQRELQVADLLSETLDVHSIAKAISVKEKMVKPTTVDTYIKRIMSKLSIHSRADLAMFCSEFREQLEKLRNLNS